MWAGKALANLGRITWAFAAGQCVKYQILVHWAITQLNSMETPQWFNQYLLQSPYIKPLKFTKHSNITFLKPTLLQQSIIMAQMTALQHNLQFCCSWKHQHLRERSGSMVECLARDRGAGGSSLTGVTVLWSLSKTYLVQPRKTRPCLTERLLMGRKESNQTNQHLY